MSTSARLGRPVELPTDLVEAREQLAALLRSSGWRGDKGAVLLATHEALLNAAQHGEGARQVTALLDGDVVIVEIADAGGGFEPGAYLQREPEPLAQRGRGLWMIGQLADSFQVQSSSAGARVRVLFDPGPLPLDAPVVLPPEPQLAAMAQAASALVGGIDVAVLLVDDQLVVRDANAQLAQLYGLERVQLLDRDYRGVLTEAGPRFGDVAAFTDRALYLAAHPQQRGDDVLALADGQLIRALALPLRNATERIVGRMELYIPRDAHRP